ncbi:polymer-forming cytoskeletal protein [Martelella alba]|uniref:Polymer-forming cytoskeletal protein n=1 Tax=Martelella alba TaxID=2590451 RepID=A0A506U334_9HYPH|nr:polymer-forming cytoskeletal protein [Martelella alba]TPW28782.1 polymer-forming cytoskeletal protein [Martelella alba]
MKSFLNGLMLAGLLVFAPAMASATEPLVFGGDTYDSGQTPTLSEASPRSAFVAGATASITAPVARDAHLAAGQVSIDAAIGGDVYAAGFWVRIDDSVGGDVTASAYSITLGNQASAGGNVRAAAREVTIDGPVHGSLLLASQYATINAEVTGDVMILAEEIHFGPNAKIDGSLIYVSAKDVDIPASVISPDRVVHKQVLASAFGALSRLKIGEKTIGIENGVTVTKDVATHVKWLSWFDWSQTGDYLFWLVVKLAVLAAILYRLPARAEAIRERLIARPFVSFGYGYLGVSMLIGTIPLAAMTLIGIPLIPIFALILIVGWNIAVIMAVYALSWSLARAIKPFEPTLIAKLIASAIGFIILSLTSLFWIGGWLIYLVIVLLGMGAMMVICAQGMKERRARRNAPPPPSPNAHLPPATTAAEARYVEEQMRRRDEGDD